MSKKEKNTNKTIVAIFKSLNELIRYLDIKPAQVAAFSVSMSLLFLLSLIPLVISY